MRATATATATAAPLPALVLVAVVMLAVVAVGAVASTPFDRMIREESEVQTPDNFDVWDPYVFDHVFYIVHVNGTNPDGSRVRTFEQARAHWVRRGMREGVRASANFSARAYLKYNPDVRFRFGDDNYPMAVVHFLTQGVNEPWRETGGPVRAPLFHASVFDWQFYVKRNQLSSTLRTEKEARDHWHDVGVLKGLQGSPHIHSRVYLAENRDLALRFGSENYVAALSYFVTHGRQETWRENGGSTCKYWGTWCHHQGSFARAMMAAKAAPPMPRYNGSGVSVIDESFEAPVPQYGGWSVSVNGRDCFDDDMRDAVEPRPAFTRVESVYHVHFRGRAGIARPCSVYVRHFVDIQTHAQDDTPEELSLARWSFKLPAPEASKKAPLGLPGMHYGGYAWRYKPADDARAEDHITVPIGPRGYNSNVTVAAFRMEDPTLIDGSPGAEKKPAGASMRATTAWSMDHHYRAPPNQFGGGAVQIGENGEMAWSRTAEEEAEIAEELKRRNLAQYTSFYQPAHVPYKNIPLPDSYYVTPGVVPVWEEQLKTNTPEENEQQQRQQAKKQQ